MRARRRGLAVAFALVAGLAVPTGAAVAGADPVGTAPVAPAGVAAGKQSTGVSDDEVARAASYLPTDDFTTTWKRADALKVRPDETTTTPLIAPDFPTIEPSVWQWDTWPLTGLNTKPLSYKGWHVIFSLVAPRSQVTFGDRHWVARIGYYVSRDGRSWKYGGQLMPEAAGIGCMEWAGTTILTGENTVRSFYTTVGHERGGPTCRTTPPFDVRQRLAVSKGQIHADANGVWFTGFREHTVIAEPDGRMYQTQEQGDLQVPVESGGYAIYDYAFRDPFVFRDPADGKVYALFEGNTGGVTGAYACKPRDLGPLPPGHVVHPDSKYFTGNVGIMEATDGTMTNWKLLPPLLSANCVNRQTERPHVVIKDGTYHLFTISHVFTYAPGVTGPDGVYGFVGPSLRSDYKPMNGSGLVLGNPPEAPEQNYSHEVLPNLMVQSFIDQVETPDGRVAGGTLAPTLQLAIDGANSSLTRVLPYGYIPALRHLG